MTPQDWLERLQCLAARLPHLGLGQDLAWLAAADLWGVYRYRKRMVQLPT